MGIMIGIGKVLLPVGGGVIDPYCAEYRAVYDALEVKPSADIAAYQNLFVKTCVDGGVWAKIDWLAVFSQTTKEGGLVNWITPGTKDPIIVLNGGTMNFTALEGFQSNDGAFIDTNLNLGDGGAYNYVQNRASAGIYIRNNIQENTMVFGVKDATSELSLQPRNALDRSAYQINTAGGGVTSPVTDSRGFHMLQRENDAANQKHYINNVLKDTEADASAAPPNNNIYIGAKNQLGVVTGEGTYQYSLFYTGIDLDATERALLMNAFETYMDSNGKGVIT